MAEGDTIIDGGNSFWKDDIARAKELRARASITSTLAPAGGVGGWSEAIA